MNNNFKYDEKIHRYFFNDQELPSVTQIVSNICNPFQPGNEWHLHRGSMIHLAINIFLSKKLNEESVDPRIRGYLESAKKAIKELNIHPVLIEAPLYHSLLLFAGTPDLLTDSNTLIDWKSGGHTETSEPQLGGYASLLEASNYPVKKAYEITLDEKRYKIFEYKPHHCKSIFHAMLTIFNWKIKRRVNGKAE